MGSRRLGALAALIAAFMLVTGMMVGLGGRASAQDDEESMAPMPAHLHKGTCDAPGEVVAPLGDIGEELLVEGTPSAGAEWMGPDSAQDVYASVTTVKVPLKDIVDGGHTLVIHESADAIQNYVACGDVGGMMMGAKDLPFGIHDLNDSGISGVAYLTDNGDGTTTVTVLVTSSDDLEGDDMEGEATPTA